MLRKSLYLTAFSLFLLAIFTGLTSEDQFDLTYKNKGYKVKSKEMNLEGYIEVSLEAEDQSALTVYFFARPVICKKGACKLVLEGNLKPPQGLDIVNGLYPRGVACVSEKGVPLHCLSGDLPESFQRMNDNLTDDWEKTFSYVYTLLVVDILTR